MKKWLLLLMLPLLAVAAFAQHKVLSGKVIDQKTQSPIPYAHLWIDGSTQGITSNVNGDFILQISSEVNQIKASAFDYQITTEPVAAVSSGQEMTIQLAAHNLMETVGVAETETGANLVRKAYANIESNHLVEKHALVGYYKEEEYAGTEMAYLAEAVVEAIMPDQRGDGHSRIFYLKGRKRILMNLEAAGITLTQGGAYQMVERSILSHIRPLQPERMKKYNYEIMGYTEIDGVDVVIVSFDKKNGRYNGNIYLSTDVFAISRIEQYIRPKKKWFAPWYWKEVSWIEQFKTNENGVWYLSTSRFAGDWSRRKDDKSHRYAGFYATTSLHDADYQPTDLNAEMERGEESFENTSDFTGNYWSGYSYVKLTSEEQSQLNKPRN